MCKQPVSTATPSVPRPHQSHIGEKVRVGPFEVYAWGTQYSEPVELIRSMDIIVPLTHGDMPFDFGYRYTILCGALKDFSGVPGNWKQFLQTVIVELNAGKKILAFCVGSHGRTGVFLASLISLLETKEETPDPIAAVRERHCEKAIETLAQAEAIFALRGQKLPGKYRKEFPAHQPAAKTG